jgi:hypothetical protein
LQTDECLEVFNHYAAQIYGDEKEGISDVLATVSACKGHVDVAHAIVGVCHGVLAAGASDIEGSQKRLELVASSLGVPSDLGAIVGSIAT